MCFWWEDSPGILQRELEAFEEAGIKFTQDKRSNKNGILNFDLEYPRDGKIIKLIVSYPDNYPYFRPDIFAPDLELIRHQHPLAKAVCLTSDRTYDWDVTWTVADFLQIRFEEALADQEAEAVDTVTEQAAPETSFLNYEINAHILWDGDWNCTAPSGKLTIKLNLNVSKNRVHLSSLVEKVKNNSDMTLHEWKCNGLSFNTTIEAPFIRAENFVYKANAREHLNHFFNLSMIPLQNGEIVTFNNKYHFSIAAVLFDENTGHNTTSPSWLFFLIEKNNKGGIKKVDYIKSHRAGPNDFATRVPSAKNLIGKKILVIGAGSIGAPIIMELAKLGAELTIVDDDIIEAAQTVRWPIGLQALDQFKILTLKNFIKTNYPYAEISTINYRVGGRVGRLDYKKDLADSKVKSRKEFWNAFHKADLIVDATAEDGVQHFISSMASTSNKNYLYVSGTPGIQGGYLGYFNGNDDHSGCWVCHRHSMYSKKEGEEGYIPIPPGDDIEGVLPVGCAHETFTGAGYDLHTLSNQAVRLIVQQFDQDLNTCFLRMSFDGPLNTPKWEMFDINKIEGCQECRQMK